MPGKLRAIDFYSGVGGWSLGLRLAGIETIVSYDRWGVANETNFKNNSHPAQTVDVRRLSAADLPKNVDFVVGSPPCTQFSFSNRGGSGDLDDGLEDIIKFLEFVDYARPKAWAMENVPRVAAIVESELRSGGRLARFKHLGMVTHVVNMEDFGLPQRRRRCIAGNFDFARLRSYAATAKKRTLGDVIDALAKGRIIDPIYGLSLSRKLLHDHIPEQPLNEEERRINRAAKMAHPVYNAMPFPDPLDRGVRTITATCTRVSRESIVIPMPGMKEGYRRLTLRERACLQGFPVTFQFYASTYAQKLRMIGNAIPPLFTYYLAQAFKGIDARRLPALKKLVSGMKLPLPAPPETGPARPGKHYPRNRRFRFAIPSLRLKSGVRFELTNNFEASAPTWRVAFYFGTSKSIRSLPLDLALYERLHLSMPPGAAKAIIIRLDSLAKFIRKADLVHMQALWNHSGVGRTRAFMLLDELHEAGEHVVAALGPYGVSAATLIRTTISSEHGNPDNLPGFAKLIRNAPLILAGLLVGSMANIEIARQEIRRMPMTPKLTMG